jgi:hypothetical protein
MACEASVIHDKKVVLHSPTLATQYLAEILYSMGHEVVWEHHN